MENTNKIVTSGIKIITKGGKGYILKGYATDKGWFGQIRSSKVLSRYFQSREDWIDYVRKNFDDGEKEVLITDIVEVED